MSLTRRVAGRLRRGLERAGLRRAFFRFDEWMIGARGGSLAFDDGRPMPSAYLVALVTGVADRKWFSEGGQRDANTFRALAVRHGIDIAARATVLDFGCGCGRIARWLAPDIARGGGVFMGLDINPRLLRWCAKNLPGVFQRNNLKAPMPVAADSVDLLYAHSVVTHLTLGTTEAWLDDFARILKRGGVAIVTFHDENWATDEVAAALGRDGHALAQPNIEGSNYMSAFVTRAFFSDLCGRRLEVSEIIPGVPEHGLQAIAVLRSNR